MYHLLNDTNWLYSKWLLNESDMEGKYLVYAPFPKQNDAEKVIDTMKARSLVAYFTMEDGEKISFNVPIVADSREENIS